MRCSDIRIGGASSGINLCRDYSGKIVSASALKSYTYSEATQSGGADSGTTARISPEAQLGDAVVCFGKLRIHAPR